MNLIQQGLEKGLIKFDDYRKYITCVHQNKRRNYSNPEERVQAESFLKLFLVYGYAPKRIELFVPVKIGSDTREADIIVFNKGYFRLRKIKDFNIPTLILLSPIRRLVPISGKPNKPICTNTATRSKMLTG